ncbi:MAG TPA: hypothetical protein VD905_06750, partial [Flavobacteriales bacterium]|nr:hypothetical protein [Flavobacteriales bacterium]
KIFHHYNTDSIRVIQTQLPDTVVKKITIPGKTIVIKEQEGKQVVWLSWAILIVLFLLLIKNFFSRGK